MIKKLRILLMISSLVMALSGAARADTISFTAQDVVTWMALQGAPLHKYSAEHGDEVWGITRVRVIPEVSVPGGYTFNINSSSISSNTVSWRVQTDATGNPPYGDGVWDTGLHASVNDTHIYGWQTFGYNSGTVYLISDLNDQAFKNSFPQYLTGVNTDLPLAKMPGDTRFNVDFTLDPGVTWLNHGFDFVVDGYWYNTWYAGASYTNPIGFNGGFAHDGVQTAGNLLGNMGDGYTGNVPVPGSVVLLGSGLLGLAGWRRFRKG